MMQAYPKKVNGVVNSLSTQLIRVDPRAAPAETALWAAPPRC
jgi:hypothetical protein